MNELWRLPVPASALLKSPEFVVLPRRECELRLSIEGEHGEVADIRLRFGGLEAYKCTFMTSCTADMFKLAYGKLVSLDSDWLDDVKMTGRKDKQVIAALRHLMITFDDGPCYEVICGSWSAIN